MRFAPASRGGWLLTAIASTVAASVGIGYSVRLDRTAAAAIAGIGLVLLVVGVSTAAVRRRWMGHARLGVAVATVACLALARGGIAVPVADANHVAGHLTDKSLAIAATVRSASPGSAGSLIVDANHLTSLEADIDVEGGLLVTGKNVPSAAPGDRVEVDASALREPDRRPGPQSEAVLEREGIEAVAVAPSVTVLEHGGLSLGRGVAGVQAKLISVVTAALPQPAASLVLGIAFGIHQPLTTDVRAPLQEAGLVHIVVVSGLKVVILLGLVSALANARQWSSRRTVCIAIPVVAAYVLVSGVGPAAVRSAVMGGVALLMRMRGRRVDPFPLMALVAAAMLSLDPRVVADPGFQLSFLGTAGILVLAEPLARRIPGPRVVAEPFAVTVAAQVATTPVMAGTFGVISIVGPVANAIVLPALPVMILFGGGGALLSLIAPPVGWVPLQLAAIGANLCVIVAGLLTKLPLSFVPVGNWPLVWTLVEVAVGAGLMVALAGKLGSRSRAAGASAGMRPPGVLAAGLALSLAVSVWSLAGGRAPSTMKVTVLDVGASTAVLVETGDGSRALIDGGSSTQQLQQALGRVMPPFTRTLGMVVVTDGKQQTMSALSAVPGHYDVSLVTAPAEMSSGPTKIIESLQAAGADVLDAYERSWTWGHATWTCLGYRSELSGQAACTLAVADGHARVLVIGDAAAGDQDDVAAMYGTHLRCDVLVAPPGGALSTALLQAAQPDVVAVPLARGGRNQAHIDGARVVQTGRDGDLHFAERGGRVVQSE